MNEVPLSSEGDAQQKNQSSNNGILTLAKYNPDDRAVSDTDVDEPGRANSNDDRNKARSRKQIPNGRHTDGEKGILGVSWHPPEKLHQSLEEETNLNDSLLPGYGTHGAGGSNRIPNGKGPDEDPPERDGLCGTNTLVYCSHFLSAWGDQMWTFAVGLYLVIIMPDTLRLTAIFGLTMGASVLLFGPILGDWIDHTARLKAAQLTLILQNLLVVLCAVVIYVFLVYRKELEDIGEWTEYLSYALMIFFASAANLATIANTITIQRDWIVEICGQNEDKLAKMTAIMRAIDLTTQVIAPIATGQIMTYAGNEFGCVFISSWNVCSVVVEYFLIWRVYNTVPALRKKKDLSQNDSKPNLGIDVDYLKQDSFTASFQRSLTQSRSNNVIVDSHSTHKERVGNKAKLDEQESGNPEGVAASKCSRTCRIFSGITIIIEGWKTYARYKVMLSGLALAMLFMTVLGFHNVTVGYAQIQGLSESVIGLMMGAAGVCGILGTLVYPIMHRWWGLPRTGMLALTLQVLCLSLCILSIWLPGSPFDLLGDDPTIVPVNCTNLTEIYPAYNESSPPTTPIFVLPTNVTCPEPGPTSMLSVSVLMAGIISARFGLWIVDLAITQMFMETVAETERGIVNGVQNSLNQMMEMIKYGLVVALPLANQFGLLVILSFTSVTAGWFLYTIFIWRVPRGMFSRGTMCAGGGYEKI